MIEVNASATSAKEIAEIVCHRYGGDFILFGKRNIRLFCGGTELDFNAAFEEALASFIRIYRTGTYVPTTEADIQACIFSLCISTCQEYGLPLDIHCNCKNEFLDSAGRKKADLIMGNSVVVEFKFEADYPGVSKPVVFPREAAADVERLQVMKSSGFPHCHFIFLDEDGMHYRNFHKYVGFKPTWEIIEREERTSYLLHKCF